MVFQESGKEDYEVLVATPLGVSVPFTEATMHLF